MKSLRPTHESGMKEPEGNDGVDFMLLTININPIDMNYFAHLSHSCMRSRTAEGLWRELDPVPQMSVNWM